jgi:hypothetical protein
MKRFALIILSAVALGVPTAALADSSTPPTPSNLATQACKGLQVSLGATFATTYGTNKSHSNAFGKCVAKGTPTAQNELNSAAATCKTEQALSDAAFGAAPNHNGKTFNQYYGSNTQAKGKGAGANALGRCVSQQAKQSSQSQSNAITAAAKQCKASLKLDAKAFALAYGSKPNAFGKCVSKLTKTS